MTTGQKRDADMDWLLRAVLKPAPREAAVECPDGGVLAAFVEGGLTATEQSSLDAHIVSCGRCQEALAVLSQDLPPQEAIATPETGWFTWVTRPRLRWLVPISAAATVAAVFFASRPLIAPKGEVVPASEVTRMAQAPAPPAELPGAAVEPSREKSAALPEKSGFAGPPERQETAMALAEKPPSPKVASDALADAPMAGERARDKKPVEPAAEMMAPRGIGRETHAAGRSGGSSSTRRQTGRCAAGTQCDCGRRCGPEAGGCRSRPCRACRRHAQGCPEPRSRPDDGVGTRRDRVVDVRRRRPPLAVGRRLGHVARSRLRRDRRLEGRRGAIPGHLLDCRGGRHRAAHDGRRAVGAPAVPPRG